MARSETSGSGGRFRRGAAAPVEPAQETPSGDDAAAELVDAAVDAAGDLAEAAIEKAKRAGAGRYLLLLAFGAVLALVLSEGLRSKALDALFGAEEEFDYTSTTAPASPAPASAAAA